MGSTSSILMIMSEWVCVENAKLCCPLTSELNDLQTWNFGFQVSVYSLLDNENFSVLVLSRGSQIGAWKCGEMVPVKDGTAVFALLRSQLANQREISRLHVQGNQKQNWHANLNLFIFSKVIIPNNHHCMIMFHKVNVRNPFYTNG